MSAIYRKLRRAFPRQRTGPNNNEATETDLRPRPTPTPQPPPHIPSAPEALEQLPFEIQRLILSQAPTFSALRALVLASPQLHAVYVQDRLRILRDFISHSFDGFLIDAHAAYLSGTDDFQLSRSNSTLWELIDGYQHRLKTVAPAELAAQLSLEHVVQLVGFHRSVIEPLTERYATWALAALSSSPEKYPLSGAERRRIQRGLYRLQVFCNVCGSRGKGRSAPRYIGGPVDRLRVLGLFPAWQIEEVLCIHEFAKDVYGGVFDRVAWDLDEVRNPRYRDVSMVDVNEDLLLFPGVHCYINRESRDSMLRHGLILLAAVLKTADHEELVELVRQSITSIRGAHGGGSYDDWLDEAVMGDHQYTRRTDWYSAEDAAQDRRDKIPFVTDTSDRPPLAWVTFWEGEVSNLIGRYVPRTFRRWGYVMWDAAHLEASGAMEYIELERRWYMGDPRENLESPVGWEA